MDLNVLIEYLPLYKQAAIITLKIGIIGIILSFLIGLLFSVLLYYKIPIVRNIILFYIELSRNTPLLIQLFFIYYGLPKVGIKLQPEICGILGLTFLGGGYMTETLLNWLNNEIVLSKSIKDISMDFRNGYLFAELLYKTKQIPKLSTFRNTNNYKDMIFNFCHLQKNFLDIGVILDENSRNEIINGSPYTSKIYLFKIKQILSKKNIDLNQLKIKESTVEIASWQDIEQCIDLIAEFLLRIDKDFDYRPLKP